jgi:hypothetical protein
MPADLEVSITLESPDVDPKLRNYCEKFREERDKYNKCMNAGEAFCGFAGGEQDRCMAAHQGSGYGPSKSYPYCERWNGESAKKAECNQGNPGFCTTQFMEQTNAWRECLQAFLPQAPPSFCDVYKDGEYPGDRQKYDDCRNPMTGFCIKNYQIGTNARNNCCTQGGYTMSKQLECKSTRTEDWGQPQGDLYPYATTAPRPAQTRPCYLGFILCKEIAL